MVRRLFLTTFLVAAPKVALACPVCFGENDSPMAQAMNSGILLMLGVVAVMLTAFASFFIYLIRRAKQAAAEEAAGMQRQEGTAQC
ncbi:MAG: hypothetical protein AUI11_08575 [Acidobacteria bacterium 13_2_20CM_2_66_4]|nr:MAG: hypothetical protein AUI11_08575 [Acidobacteria bacterium 13_2_20CM_2_66_4]PYQ70787.1 MAG: hypothetical protein DMG01_26920 [Acidobacteriota bacterium]